MGRVIAGKPPACAASPRARTDDRNRAMKCHHGAESTQDAELLVPEAGQEEGSKQPFGHAEDRIHSYCFNPLKVNDFAGIAGALPID